MLISIARKIPSKSDKAAISKTDIKILSILRLSVSELSRDGKK
jgi:hypothetical protein